MRWPGRQVIPGRGAAHARAGRPTIRAARRRSPRHAAIISPGAACAVLGVRADKDRAGSSKASLFRWRRASTLAPRIRATPPRELWGQCRAQAGVGGADEALQQAPVGPGPAAPRRRLPVPQDALRWLGAPPVSSTTLRLRRTPETVTRYGRGAPPSTAPAPPPGSTSLQAGLLSGPAMSAEGSLVRRAFRLRRGQPTTRCRPAERGPVGGARRWVSCSTSAYSLMTGHHPRLDAPPELRPRSLSTSCSGGTAAGPRWLPPRRSTDASSCSGRRSELLAAGKLGTSFSRSRPGALRRGDARVPGVPAGAFRDGRRRDPETERTDAAAVPAQHGPSATVDAVWQPGLRCDDGRAVHLVWAAEPRLLDQRAGHDSAPEKYDYLYGRRVEPGRARLAV